MLVIVLAIIVGCCIVLLLAGALIWNKRRRDIRETISGENPEVRLSDDRRGATGVQYEDPIYNTIEEFGGDESIIYNTLPETGTPIYHTIDSVGHHPSEDNYQTF